MPKRTVLGAALLACLVGSAGQAPTAVAARDRDSDKMPDRWERKHGLSPVRPNASKDPDKDGLRNRKEYRLRTHPRRRDTDRDGLGDRREIRKYKTNPRRKDTDGDGFTDLEEIRAGTNPRSKRSKPAPRGAAPAPGATGGAPAGAAGPGGIGPGAAGRPPAVPCTVRSPAQLVAAAAAPGNVGRTVGVCAGNYGSIDLSGIQPAGQVLLRADRGVVVGQVRAQNTRNLRLDGFVHAGPVDIPPSAQTSGLAFTYGEMSFSISGDTNVPGFHLQGGSGTLIQGYHVHDLNELGIGNTGVCVKIAGGGANSRVIGNLLERCRGGGVGGFGVGNLLVEGNVIRGVRPAAGSAIHADPIWLQNGNGVVIRSNWVYDNDQAAVIFAAVNGLLWENNVFARTGNYAINLQAGASNVVLRQNTLWGGGYGGLLVQGSAGQVTGCTNNVIQSLAEQGGSCRNGANVIGGSPAFVNAGALDYRVPGPNGTTLGPPPW